MAVHGLHNELQQFKEYELRSVCVGLYKGEKINDFIKRLEPSQKLTKRLSKLRSKLEKLERDSCVYLGFGVPPWEVPQYFEPKKCKFVYLTDPKLKLVTKLRELKQILESI